MFHWWNGDTQTRRRAIWTPRDQRHADVLHAVLRQAWLPGAPRIFPDAALLDLLHDAGLRAALLA
ncbi:hypothetical protein AB0F91_14405 [Amycolatopsis sp. NPDC023774]|uniref:hypothetical protein n=1 Tax=Amycolatopsis sp. NPDC023774 TaxID=3155015 RepID=UPI0033E8E00B